MLEPAKFLLLRRRQQGSICVFCWNRCFVLLPSMDFFATISNGKSYHRRRFLLQSAFVTGGGYIRRPRKDTTHKQNCYNRQTKKLRRAASWDGHHGELQWSPCRLRPWSQLRRAGTKAAFLLHMQLGAPFATNSGFAPICCIGDNEPATTRRLAGATVLGERAQWAAPSAGAHTNLARVDG